MSKDRTPLFVRLPRTQAVALDRLATATGRPKQHLVSELIGDRLMAASRPLAVGRIEVAAATDSDPDDVLTLEETAAMLKVSTDAVRVRAEEGDIPGRLFGKEWRFARAAVLAWLADPESGSRD